MDWISVQWERAFSTVGISRDLLAESVYKFLLYT